MNLSHHSSCSYYISIWHVQERNQFGWILHIWGTLETFMSPVNHTTSGGEYKRGLDSRQLIIFATSFTVLLKCTWKMLIKTIGIGSGSVSTCKRWQVFGWKVHFWHSIFRQILGFLAYNWTIYWTMDINLTHTHNVHTLEYLYSKIEWYNYRFKGTTGVLDLYLQHTSNVNGLWESV